MKMNKIKIIISVLLLLVVGGFALAGYFFFRSNDIPWRTPDLPITDLGKVDDKREFPLVYPDDYELSVFADGLGKVRDILPAPNGIIVSSMQSGKLMYLPDRNNDNIADEKIILLEDCYNPHGSIDYCDKDGQCWFFLAETDAIYRFKYNLDNISLSDEEKIIELPDDGGHYTRDVLVRDDPNGPRLYIAVGSKCNACVEEDWRRGKILVSDLDGSNLKEYASGLRNSVFITLSPFDNEIYAGDMGRDWLGDELPLEEINLIKEDQDYGWPICHGDKIHDTEFDNKNYLLDPCQSTVAPIISMPAHSAPLGLDFIPEEGFGTEYHHDILIAQHGSWNRSTPIGYKVVRMKMDKEGNYLDREDFLSGFLTEGDAWGRPADVSAVSGGKVYVSDDKAGMVYLLEYKK